MIGEPAIQMMATLKENFTRIKIAMQLEGRALGAKTIVPAAHILIHDSIARAEDYAELLSIRGYRSGGTICPKFNSDRMDIFGSLCAIFILIFSLFSVREFFILYH